MVTFFLNVQFGNRSQSEYDNIIVMLLKDLSCRNACTESAEVYLDKPQTSKAKTGVYLDNPQEVVVYVV